LLLARRLCEAGCGFVTIHADYEGIWDMHADVENLNMIDGMETVGRSFDHAVAAFIEDVEARGLSEKILLVCCGEMGRTPKINKNGGRDHWGDLTPLVVAGGGLKMGQVIGKSDKQGGRPATEPHTPANLLATILHFLFDVPQLRLRIYDGRAWMLPGDGDWIRKDLQEKNSKLKIYPLTPSVAIQPESAGNSAAELAIKLHSRARAANLVRQLLAFSRQQTLQPRVLNVTDVLYELRHLLERLIGENIDLEVVHGRDLGLAKVDQGQLEQVIINLAVNARDAMPGGGTLTIRTANVREERELRRGHEMMPAGDYVLIELADTGVGIAKENLARIFDPFFSTKELGSGTGLGLSTVYGIVKQTGGFVFVTSAPGRGAAFQIFLPRFQAADGALPDRADGNEATAIKDLTGLGTVMLVEDDDPVRIFGARALRNKGYKVIEATSGEAALDLIRNAAEKIDLLITDVVMPHMDGPGLVREVREIHPEMKVIFISGYTEDAFRQRLDSDSGIDFLPKPFSLKELAAKVRDVIAAGLA